MSDLFDDRFNSSAKSYKDADESDESGTGDDSTSGTGDDSTSGTGDSSSSTDGSSST